MRRLWKVNLSSLMCTSIILILLSCNGKGEHIRAEIIFLYILTMRYKLIQTGCRAIIELKHTFNESLKNVHYLLNYIKSKSMMAAF